MFKPGLIEGASFPIRRPQIDFDQGIDQHYLKNNAIISHCFGGLNLLFPSGEQFFVDSVRKFSSKIKDPNLIADVKIFCGQETQHKNLHSQFIQQLEKQGYKLGNSMKRIKWYIDHVGGLLPDVIQLSTTVACEHWTATMAHSAFKNKILDEGSLPVRQLIIWHAIEEMEHKNVAFDVFNTLYPKKYFFRLLGFIVSCVTIYM
ncbi:MAG: metal-dependent hydrolase, partial [Candidatus Paceibacterales bacterium]